MGKNLLGTGWRIQRHFRKINIEVPHTAHKLTPRDYTYLPAYLTFICDVFTANHDELTRRDLDLMMFLFRNRYFVFKDMLHFPQKPRRWGSVSAKKTVDHLIRRGWARVHKNNGRSNPRIYAFTDKACVELTRLYRVLYFMEPIGTAKFPVKKKFYDNPSYARALHDINKLVKSIKKEGVLIDPNNNENTD